MQLIPVSAPAQHEEVLRFIELHHGMGQGLQYVAVHLSASALLTGVSMWTYDRKLDEANETLGIRYDPGLAG